ncbi:putative AC transposase [Trichonephila clavata]|uniref:Putative AC transposase n=1 Tax=Trichonephila clavata TaxID=2740835 RepID=A0A8X6H2S4_TRICU|nr:putative AC transposase [Trichonephila clavata]
MRFKNIPKSANTVRKIVIEYSNKLRNSVIREITDKKINGNIVGERFSLSFDEWTSLRNRRYLNIIVHGQFSDFWSLGLARIYGSLPAEKCIELLEEKLAKHKINLHTDIVDIMTDGASVMKKNGQNIICRSAVMFCTWCAAACY